MNVMLILFVAGAIIVVLTGLTYAIEYASRYGVRVPNLPKLPPRVAQDAPSAPPAPLTTPAQKSPATSPLSASPEWATPKPKVAPLGEWWPAVVGAHHVLLSGATQSGKSTTARALLASRQVTDAIVVIDPHGKLNHWGDVPVIGIGRDWTGIDAALTRLDAELSRRYADGQEIGQPTTIFIDEWPSIVSECGNARKALTRIAREGAKVGLKLVVLAQETTVRALGIEGEGDVRRNFTRLLLGEAATREIGDAGAHPAALDTGNGARAVDRSKLPEIAASVKRFEAVPVVVAPSPSTPEPSGQTDGRTDAPANALAAAAPPPPDGRTAIPSREELIVELVKRGATVAQIRDIVRGSNEEIGLLVKKARGLTDAV